MTSLAIGQRSLGDTRIGYPLWPPLISGCPKTSTAETAYPVDVDYDRVPADFTPELLLPPLMVVCISTSSGFEDATETPPPPAVTDWPGVQRALRSAGLDT